MQREGDSAGARASEDKGGDRHGEGEGDDRRREKGKDIPDDGRRFSGRRRRSNKKGLVHGRQGQGGGRGGRLQSGGAGRSSRAKSSACICDDSYGQSAR